MHEALFETGGGERQAYFKITCNLATKEINSLSPDFTNFHTDSLRIATHVSRYLPILKRLYILDTLAYAILQYFMVGTS